MISLIRPALLLGTISIALVGQALAQAPTTPAPAPVPTVPAPAQTTVPAPSPVQGQDAPRQIEIKDSHLAAARELIEASHILDTFERLLPNILQQVGLTLTSQNLVVQADPKKRAALIESLKTVEQSFIPERDKLFSQIALVYAARFSEPELRKIVEFLNSPEGKKFATVSPLVAQDSFRIANDWADRIGQEAFEKVRAEMRKRGEPLQ